MSRQVVEFVEYAPQTMRIKSSTEYEFRSDKGWKWLQRLCFWVLRKLDCYAYGEKVEYVRHVIDTPDLIKRIHKQHDSLLEHYHRRGERLLIGAETLAELMGTPRINQYLDFSAEYGFGRSIMGMRITVVPHMRGLVVLPKC